ncbi:MAG: tetratricopeptide repeat protein [Planctomycetaceae bacterium]
MTPRTFFAILCVLFIFTNVVPPKAAHAQFRLFGDDDDDDDRDSRKKKLNPKLEDAKRSAEQAYKQGDFDKAIQITDGVLQEAREDDVAYYLRGSARVEKGLRNGDKKLIRAGIADAREAIRFAPEKSALYHLPYLYGLKSLAVLENRREHADLAVQAANLALQIRNLKSEEKAHLLYQRATANVWLRKLDAAIEDCRQAVTLLPSHLGAHVVLAEAYAASGKRDEALASYGKAIELFPDNPLVYNNRGMFQQQQGRNSEAVADFTRAIELNPDYYYSYINRGFALLQSDDPKSAEADFSAALRVNSNQAQVYNLRAQARLAQGNTAGAVADSTHVTQLMANDPVAHGDLGFTLFFTKDYARALASFDQAVKLSPNMRYLDPWRYWCLVAQNRETDANSRFADTLGKDPAMRDWADRLLAYVAGTLSEADLRASLDPKDEAMKRAQTCEAEFFSALKKAREGNAEEAMAHYQKALDTGAKHLSAYRGAKVAAGKSGGTTPAAASTIPARSN